MGKIMNSVYQYRSNNMDSEIIASALKGEFPKNVMRLPNIKYCDKSNRNLVDVYRPSNTLDTLPSILYIHGGGLIAGSKEAGAQFCANLASCGFVVFAIEYRRIPKANAYEQIHDVIIAMDFVAENAAAFGADPHSAYMIGDGAGAFLAVYSMAADNEQIARAFKVSPSKLEINAAVFISGMFYISRQDKVGLFLAESALGRGYKKTAVSKYINPGCNDVVDTLPPCYFISGESDDLLRYTENMLKAFESVGADYRVSIYKKDDRLVRSFPVLHPNYPESRSMVRYIASFFMKHKKGCEVHAKCG